MHSFARRRAFAVSCFVAASLAIARAAAVAQENAPASAEPPTQKPEPPPEPFAANHPLQPALALITVDDLKDYEAWLASDERKGRCAGEPSCDEAAEWIADRFEEWGLEPIGDDHTFLQHFEFRVRGGGGRDAKTQNVVGFLEGSDPELKKQVVVLGAHYDHVGTLQSFDAGRIGGAVNGDTIWNGADDNASGTSSIVEIAKAFAESGIQPKRSLVFIAFSGEEQGLFGSQWWCAHPLIPLEQTVAMVNLDMVGRNETKPISLSALGSLDNDLWKKLVAASRGAAPSLTFDFKNGWNPDSDHASFLNAQIPAAFLEDDEQVDYHRVTDSPDKIAYERMAEICKFATALAWNAGNSAEKFTFVRQVSPRAVKRLGIGSDGALDAKRMAELGFGKEQGGFAVNGLDPEGVGAKAGLKEGDVLLSIDGTTLSPDDPATSVRRLIAGAPRGKDVAIVVWREKAKITLTARWE